MNACVEEPIRDAVVAAGLTSQSGKLEMESILDNAEDASFSVLDGV